MIRFIQECECVIIWHCVFVRQRCFRWNLNHRRCRRHWVLNWMRPRLAKRAFVFLLYYSPRNQGFDILSRPHGTSQTIPGREFKSRIFVCYETVHLPRDNLCTKYPRKSSRIR